MRSLLQSQITNLESYIDNRESFDLNIATFLNHQYSYLFNEDNRKFLKLTIAEPFDNRDKEIWLDCVIPVITDKLKERIKAEERLEAGYHSDDTEATVAYEEESPETTTFTDKEEMRKEKTSACFTLEGR